ncbi:MAG TPA: 50S ribosomal protein L22 [Alphaproteobacteria bacterium]|nr:50S ribosomal protein L22 [Alphaproteobacteria bacterium]HAJ45527.1 50S ribosomal protein L22 [Alphaproteobacteria bacterium]
MSKPERPRRWADNEAMAKGRMIRTSPRKLNLVAQLIRGKKVAVALSDLTFSEKRIAGEVKKVLQAAIANAENNHGLDVDELVVAEAWTGKSMVMKRFHPRGRGKSAPVQKFFSEVTILLRAEEVKTEERPKPTLRRRERREAKHAEMRGQA